MNSKETGESRSPEASFPGDLFSLEMEGSELFPGTVRPLWAYLPTGMERDRAYPVMVFNDGHALIEPAGPCDVPAVLDQLILEGTIPPLVGLFVKWGTVPAPNPPSGRERVNRSFEYEGMGDRYARFLSEEVIPLVEEQLDIRISRDPDLRGLGGSGSGGLAALNAAFFRPDLFRRVYSGPLAGLGSRGARAWRRCSGKRNRDRSGFFWKPGGGARASMREARTWVNRIWSQPCALMEARFALATIFKEKVPRTWQVCRRKPSPGCGREPQTPSSRGRSPRSRGWQGSFRTKTRGFDYRENGRNGNTVPMDAPAGPWGLG
jgi:hypothetical protein